MVSELNHRLASLYGAVGNAVRIRALEYLREVDEAYLGEICEELDRSSNSMSGHMTKLADYDLVRSKTRGRKKYFWIKREDLVDALLAIRDYLQRDDD
jgi:DNA-binding transcriptional ArsR family regulator